MRSIILSIILFSILACGKDKHNSTENITVPATQEAVFKSLMTVVQNAIPGTLLNDSLSFLILPVQASCPSCRKKTIDSIMKHQQNLNAKKYIIISANGGRKTINSYFREQEYNLPEMPGRLLLDSINLALKNDLYKDKPTIYYTWNKKAYKKVAAIPATVREDLREFFTGHR